MLLLFAVSSCTPSEQIPPHPNDRNINQSLASEIKTCYVESRERFNQPVEHPEELCIWNRGKYGDCYIVYMDTSLNYPAIDLVDRVAGMVFVDLRDTFVYYDKGILFSLQGAYSQGLLTKEDILDFGRSLSTEPILGSRFYESVEAYEASLKS